MRLGEFVSVDEFRQRRGCASNSSAEHQQSLEHDDPATGEAIGTQPAARRSRCIANHRGPRVNTSGACVVNVDAGAVTTPAKVSNIDAGVRTSPVGVVTSDAGGLTTPMQDVTSCHGVVNGDAGVVTTPAAISNISAAVVIKPRVNHVVWLRVILDDADDAIVAELF